MTPYPPAQRQDIVEEIHGHRVADPYRWLEDAGSEATTEWLAAQDKLFHKVARCTDWRSEHRQSAKRVSRMRSVRNARFGRPVSESWCAMNCRCCSAFFRSVMSIELVTSRLSEQARRLVTYVNYLIICVFLVYLIGAGLWISWVGRARTFQGIPAISYSWITMSLPVGASLLLITTILKFREEIQAQFASDPTPR
jgi:hypothetical protein